MSIQAKTTELVTAITGFTTKTKTGLVRGGNLQANLTGLKGQVPFTNVVGQPFSFVAQDPVTRVLVAKLASQVNGLKLFNTGEDIVDLETPTVWRWNGTIYADVGHPISALPAGRLFFDGANSGLYATLVSGVFTKVNP